MAGMKSPINGRFPPPPTILLIFAGLVLSLRGLHVISADWTVAAFFLVIIPFAILKAFADFRQR
jgi:hypothetical protein